MEENPIQGWFKIETAMTSSPESSVACALSIIIPTWNSGAPIGRCLGPLRAQEVQDFEVILVDNGSHDYLPGRIPQAFSSLPIREIAFPENRGFAAACNLGAHHACGQWLAFLNADAFPEPDWLAAFYDGLRRFPDANAFSSLILQDENPSLIDSAGDGYSVNGFAWKGLNNYPLESVKLEPRRVFSPCAAAAFYQREVFMEAGGFDEDFFSYSEDTDLGFRLNLYGYKCTLLPDAHVQHVGSASTGKMSDFALYHSQRNAIWCYIKNMPGFFFWLYLPNHILANLLYLLKYVLAGQGKPVWKAKRDALKGLSEAFRKRKKIQAARRASPAEILSLMNRNPVTPYLRRARLQRALRT